jgi:hypothetical protein
MIAQSLSRTSLTVVLTGVAYLLLFLCNEHLLSFTRFADGVNWIYLPSGLRMTLVLVFGAPAALGIAWSSMLLTAWPQGWDSWVQALVTGVISGGAPLLALLACRRALGLKADLSGLKARTLLLMAVIFAIISAALHQIWYGWSYPAPDRALQFAVMALGDLVGTVLVLYLAYWVLKKTAPRL